MRYVFDNQQKPVSFLQTSSTVIMILRACFNSLILISMTLVKRAWIFYVIYFIYYYYYYYFFTFYLWL